MADRERVDIGLLSWGIVALAALITVFAIKYLRK